MIASLFAIIKGSRAAQVGLVVLACGLAALAFNWWLNGERKEAATQAVTQDRAKGLETTINRMEQADETRRDIADERSRARYDECLQSARNPSNCQRFVPQ
jgi:membrane protein implicated in regulation of membrane protease activity